MYCCVCVKGGGGGGGGGGESIQSTMGSVHTDIDGFLVWINHE